MVVMVAALLAGAAGCRPGTIDATYGRRRGAHGGRSVNGTVVLARMFEQAGHRVSTQRFLSSKLDSVDVVVWFPDDFEPPTPRQRAYLEHWLREGDRTLVYVGRDFDASIGYYRGIRSGAPQSQKAELHRRQAKAQADHAAARGAIERDEFCRWFCLRSDGTKRDVRTVGGPWSEGVDGEKLDVELATRLDIPTEQEQSDAESDEEDDADSEDATLMIEEDEAWDEDGWYHFAPDFDPTLGFEPLLTSEGHAIISRVVVPGRSGTENQIIVAANGSFLLNLPLVNREHRKLAGRLIEQCGTPGRTVFLESTRGGPPIAENGDRTPTGLEALTVWPMMCVLLHLAVLGMIYCCSVFPIFGRPREPAPDRPADFGKHVASLGKLLAATGNRRYAQEKLSRYHATVRRDSGKSHAKSPAGQRAGAKSSSADKLPDPHDFDGIIESAIVQTRSSGHDAPTDTPDDTQSES